MHDSHKSGELSYVSPVTEDIQGERFTLAKPKGPLVTIRWACGFLVNHPVAQKFLIYCIVGNSLLLGISATDLVVSGQNVDFWVGFVDTVDFIFMVIFTIESALQFIYHWLYLFTDLTLTFDMMLVLMSWLFKNATVFKSLRVLRAFRLLQIGPMKDLLIALTTVAPKLGMITLLSILMLYIFAVMFTQLFKDDNEYFSRLDITIFTLLQMMTFDFATIMRDTMKQSRFAWIPFMAFLLTMGFLMFNLTVAVVCDAVGEMRQFNSDLPCEREIKRNIRYKLYSTTTMISEVILVQQQLIEEHLELVSLYYTKQEQKRKERMKKIEDDLKFKTVAVTTPEKPLAKIKENSEDQNEPEDALFKPNGFFAAERLACGEFVNRDSVQWVILICIILNCAVMGMGATDLYYNPTAVHIFELVDKVFLVIFSIESSMQFFHLGYLIFKDGWATFDLLIVIFSWALENFQVVRGFRVIRALRVTLRVGPIKDLLSTLFTCIEKLSAIILLSLLILYIFAVLFTQLYKKVTLEVDYYGRLDFTLFTLMQMMTLDFATPMRNVMDTYQSAWIPHLLFVLVMGFISYNLMAGVICDAIQHLDHKIEHLAEESDEIADLSFRLRCLSYEIKILSNAKKTVHEHIATLSEIIENENRKRDKYESEQCSIST